MNKGVKTGNELSHPLTWFPCVSWHGALTMLGAFQGLLFPRACLYLLWCSNKAPGLWEGGFHGQFNGHSRVTFTRHNFGLAHGEYNLITLEKGGSLYTIIGTDLLQLVSEGRSWKTFYYRLAVWINSKIKRSREFLEEVVFYVTDINTHERI